VGSNPTVTADSRENMEPKSYTIAGTQFSVNLENDAYGDSMWHGAETGVWESATVGFVITNCDPQATFFDFGAASGIFSLIAASRGARVIAVEPHPEWSSALRENIKLNEVSGEIIPVQAAISSYDGELNFENNRDSSVISDSAAMRAEGSTKVVSLETILATHPAGKTILKIDIEGAEYGLLLKANSLGLLAAKKARVFISLHPGFPYQKVFSAKSPAWVANSLKVKFLGLFDNVRFFRRVNKFAEIRLPNGREVKKLRDFLVMTEVGVHDFLLVF
jgi:FkbM family methyltransferase